MRNGNNNKQDEGTARARENAASNATANGTANSASNTANDTANSASNATANGANNASATANGTANSAHNASTTANSTAHNATATANGTVNSASNATANSASATANGAANTASNASVTANGAHNASATANNAANSANGTANSANNASNATANNTDATAASNSSVTANNATANGAANSTSATANNTTASNNASNTASNATASNTQPKGTQVDATDSTNVAQTLKRIAEEKKTPKQPQKRTFKQGLLKAAKVVFFPITFIAWGFSTVAKKNKISITAKSTLVFTLVFALLLSIYVVFILVSLERQLTPSTPEITAFMTRLKITSVILCVVFVIVSAVISIVAIQTMLNPIRKMTQRVREISSENLSARLDPVESQDELMELTDEINNTLTSLQNAFESQANFVSDASHELKTPLSVIIGYASLLKRWGKDDPKMLDEGIESIIRESENMKKIVDQLLWLAKLGNFALTNVEFNLYEAIQDVVDGYAIIKTTHTITLNGSKDITLFTDRALFTEAVRTLIDNAIKYSPAEGGKISINISPTQEGVNISVTDNGIGISEQDLPHVFDRFYRCDKARGREKGSSGLGLTIAKSIIEMLNGTIKVDSVLGEGTVFTIELR